MKSILDPSFRYTNAANTDIAKTFARVRREIRQAAEAANAKAITAVAIRADTQATRLDLERAADAVKSFVRLATSKPR